MNKIKEFLDSEIIPLEPLLLNSRFAPLLESLEKLRAKVKNAGWWAPFLPSSEGGMGLSLLQFAELSEILGRSPLGHYAFNCQAPDVGNMELLRQHGSNEQKEKYLKTLTDGSIRSCFAMTEPDRPGSNPTWMDASATEDCDNYIINGRKWFTSSADGASFCIVMAVTDPGNKDKYSRASMFIVETENPGFQIVRNISVMGDPGEGYFSHSEVEFNNCRIHNKLGLIGETGSGFKLAQERLSPGRIHHCMRWIGICERSFDLMCQRASDRSISPGRKLLDEGIIQNWIAESRAEIDAARLLVLKCVNAIETDGSFSARMEVSIIKFYVADVLRKVLDRAIQIHGALGMTDDTPLAFWYRHERGARIYDGPDEVHKRAVARQILKRYSDSS